jgi:hypothetical protein
VPRQLNGAETLAPVGRAGSSRQESIQARRPICPVTRNASGAIVAIHANSNADATEERPDNPELAAFMTRRPDGEEIKAVRPDAELIRVIEDPTEVLVRKQFICRPIYRRRH